VTAKALGRVLGIAGLAVLSWVYCQPRHPSAGDAPLLDAVLHCGLFAVIAVWFARAIGARLVVFIPLLALAVGLEWLQWWRGGYGSVEIPDILWNVIGLLLGWRIARGRKLPIARRA
jgi:hypothetical protein